MYCGVPMLIPLSVSRRSPPLLSSTRAIPKSATSARFQGTRDVARDAHRLGDWKLAFPIQAITQRLALHEGHDVVDDAVRHAGIVQRDDVRMVQRGRRPDLAQEPLGAHTLGDVLAQDLDGHPPVVPDVAREEDCRHAPLTRLALDRIALRQ